MAYQISFPSQFITDYSRETAHIRRYNTVKIRNSLYCYQHYWSEQPNPKLFSLPNLIMGTALWKVHCRPKSDKQNRWLKHYHQPSEYHPPSASHTYLSSQLLSQSWYMLPPQPHTRHGVRYENPSPNPKRDSSFDIDAILRLGWLVTLGSSRRAWNETGFYPSPNPKPSP